MSPASHPPPTIVFCKIYIPLYFQTIIIFSNPLFIIPPSHHFLEGGRGGGVGGKDYLFLPLTFFVQNSYQHGHRNCENILKGFRHLLCCLLMHDEKRRRRVLSVRGELREETTFQHVVGTLGAHYLRAHLVNDLYQISMSISAVFKHLDFHLL